MGRTPRCSKDGLNKGAWTSLEDKILTDYVKLHGEGKWSNVAKQTGLKRCGKSCRLRWMNYLRPDIKRGNITQDEEDLIIRLHKLLGNRWSLIAGRLPGRTDNEIKNFWNTNLAKKPKHQFKSSSAHDSENDNSKCTTPKCTRPAKVVNDDDALDHQGAADHGAPTTAASSVDGNLLKKARAERDLYRDQEPVSKELDINLTSSDFIMDFNVEDICKFLDTDLMKPHDDHISNSLLEGNYDQQDIDYRSKHSSFPDKMEESWRGGSSECGGVDMSSPDLLSLASSFLEAAGQEWPGDDLNIIQAPH